MPKAQFAEVIAVRHRRGEPPERVDDAVIVEEPLEIRVDGETLALTMRTPGHDAELALGFLLSEGIVRSAEEVGSAVHCGRPGDEDYGNVIDVRSAPGRPLDVEGVERARRGTLTTAACGICGRTSIEDLLSRVRPLEATAHFERRTIEGLAAKLRALQPAFARTGGAHAAALATPDGELELVREDVGRHNAVDKVFGRRLLDQALPATDRILTVSGRVSFEIVQKAVAAGAPAVVGISAPTSLAVQTAQAAGMLLVGFSRDTGFQLYAGTL
jgi:FdhD protein